MAAGFIMIWFGVRYRGKFFNKHVAAEFLMDQNHSEKHPGDTVEEGWRAQALIDSCCGAASRGHRIKAPTMFF